MTVNVSLAIEKALDEHGLPTTDQPVVRASEHPCEGARFHSPQPLVTRHWKFGDYELYLCLNCESKLEILLHLEDRSGGLDWPTQREFGNQIRLIATRVCSSTGKTVG